MTAGTELPSQPPDLLRDKTMTHPGNATELSMGQTQLPVSVYFDECLYQRELELLFKNRPQYVGHELMVPNEGDYQVLASEQNGRALIRDKGQVRLLSNVCRHRQAIMLTDRGNAQNIVCPLHRWTYDRAGKLLGAPHFADDPCLNLHQTPVQSWNGMLFKGGSESQVARDLAQMGVADKLNFDNYALGRIEQHTCNYNWKTFSEVYLEDYHVAPFHPGLSGFVTCDDLAWQFGEHYSVQTVGVFNQLAKPGSPAYQKWHDEVLKYQNGAPPAQGAIWLTYYPNVMVEWYPNTLVVSTLYPQGLNQTLNVVEYYYHDDIVAFEPDYMEAQRNAYMETVLEDDEIAERMDQGRRALYERGDNEVGPYQSPMEDGMQHFHAWYRRMMAL